MVRRLPRTSLTVALCALAAACSGASTEGPEQAAVANAGAVVPDTPAETGGDWRPVAAENLLILKTKYGDTLIELNPDFAPSHVDRMRKLAAGRALNGARFYRVIDGFVAQAGLYDRADDAKWPGLPLEAERSAPDDSRFAPLGNADLFAPEAGHVDGFAAARDAGAGAEWLLHCPGAVAMARGDDAASGGTEFYVVLGPQRYLDRNLSVFGRVVLGLEHIQKLQRGDPDVDGGVISPIEKADTIISAVIASELPEDERPKLETIRTDTDSFRSHKDAQRRHEGVFYIHSPPSVLGVCSVDVPARSLD